MRTAQEGTHETAIGTREKKEIAIKSFGRID
jgi:hypothetical protein